MPLNPQENFSLSSHENIILKNNSGRKLDAVAMWHTGGKPIAADYMPDEAFIAEKNVAAGATLTKNNLDVWSTPEDFWGLAVKFEGDDECYAMCGYLGAAYKIYLVEDGHTVTFVLNAYSKGTANQNDIDIYYDKDPNNSHQTAYLLNHTTVEIISLAEALASALLQIAGDD